MSTRPAVAMSIVALAAGLALAGCDASHPDVDFAGGEVADARAAATSELTRALDDVAAGDDALTHVGRPPCATSAPRGRTTGRCLSRTPTPAS